MAFLGGIIGAIGELVGIGKNAGLIRTPEDEMKYRQQLMDYFSQQDNFLTQQANAIAQTMQAEAKSEHWAQWMWRPMVGFSFCAVIVNNYILMPYLQKYLQPIVIPDQVWSAMLVILGAAAATRGWQKVVEAQNQAITGNKNGNGNDALAPARQPSASTPPSFPSTVRDR